MTVGKAGKKSARAMMLCEQNRRWPIGAGVRNKKCNHWKRREGGNSVTDGDGWIHRGGKPMQFSDSFICSMKYKDYQLRVKMEKTYW